MKTNQSQKNIPFGWVVDKFNNRIVLSYGSSLPGSKREDGLIPVYGSNGIVGTHSESFVRGPGIIVGRKGTIGVITWSGGDFWPIDTTYFVEHDQSLQLRWLYYKLQSLGLSKMNSASGTPGLNREEVYKLNIEIPTTEEQKRIAEILGAIDEEIKKTDEVIVETGELKKGLMQKFFEPNTSKSNKIHEIARVLGGKRLPAGHDFSIEKTKHAYIRVIDFKDLSVDQTTIKYISEETFEEIKKYIITKDDIYISIAGTIGRVGAVPKELDGANLTENAARIVLKEKNDLVRDYITYFLCSDSGRKQIVASTVTTTQPKLALNKIEQISIPIGSKESIQEITSTLKSIDEKILINEQIRNRLLLLRKGLMQDLLTGKKRTI